ncbi:MAG: hypothetical protein ABIM99_00215 [Candidatus Dojkabacteria bacterium]
MAKSVTFNLLKPLQPPKTAWDKIYDWIVDKARIVVLITILLIAAAFVAKVIVDTDAKNKNKQIDALTQRLGFYSAEVEPRLRLLAIKTEFYSTIWNKSSAYSAVIKEVYSYVDNPGADLTIKAGDGKISIFGTEDLNLLRNLEESLRNSPTFTSVTFGSLSIDGSDLQDSKGEYSVSAEIKDTKRTQL